MSDHTPSPLPVTTLVQKSEKIINSESRRELSFTHHSDTFEKLEKGNYFIKYFPTSLFIQVNYFKSQNQLSYCLFSILADYFNKKYGSITTYYKMFLGEDFVKMFIAASLNSFKSGIALKSIIRRIHK